MNRIKASWKSYLLISLGCLLVAISMNVFLIPYKLAPGGVSGLSTVLFHLFGGTIPVGTIMIALNIPLFLIGYRSKGRQFVVRSVFGSLMLSVLIDVTAPFLRWLVSDYFVYFDNTMAEPDLLLYSLIGGAIMGFGLAIVLKEDATTGGTDLMASVLNNKIPKFSVGQHLLFMDLCVVIFATIAFRSVKLGLYTTLCLYISSKTIDAYLEGINFSKALLIISEKQEEISERLMDEVGRGVTGLKGHGMYTKQDKTVLLCVVKREEIPTVKDIVRACDNKSFILLIDVREVLGEGFIPLESLNAEKESQKT
ncbi:MAG: YitT family protein [Clostridiaceae bacterium]|nr:YitT family protein [Clostridiaceae bacterium]